MVINKSALTIGSLAFALLFGGGMYVFMNLGSIAKTVSERIASETLGVRVTINKMEISLQEKKVDVRGFEIGNPKGYKRASALTTDHIHIALGDLSKELIEFKDISVKGTNVFVEVSENGTNLNDIKKNLSRKKPAGKAEKAESSEGGEAKKPVKVIIDRLVVGETKLEPSVTLTDSSLVSITVPAMTLRDVGRKQNGVLASEAIAQIWSTLSKRFNASAMSAGFLEGLSTDILKDIGVSNLKQIKDSIKGDVDALKDGVKSLFGN